MAIKEELKEGIKEEGGGKDELEALDALEREAAEYNKVGPKNQLLFLHLPLLTCTQDAEIDRILKAFKLDA